MTSYQELTLTVWQTCNALICPTVSPGSWSPS